MDFLVKIGSPSQHKTDMLICATNINLMSDHVKAADIKCNGIITSVLRSCHSLVRMDQSMLLLPSDNHPFSFLCLLSVGDNKKYLVLNEKEYVKFIGLLAHQIFDNKEASEVSIFLDDLEVEKVDIYWKIRRLVEGIIEKNYSFDQFKSKDKKKKTVKKVTILTENKDNKSVIKKAIDHAKAIGFGSSVAKDLGNMPANYCTPSYLAKQAELLSKNYSNLKSEVLNEVRMKELGMHTFLSVGQGSDEESKLIVMEYQGSNEKKDPPIVLLGKGVTFDSGGISIKPSAKMDEMKFDMCGAASVFGVMNAIIELNLPINVVGMVASAENMPSSSATRPGDIVTSMSGQTVEILNTDAEGRLVLCDALTYAERYKPKAVIDIATLTGACIVALGHHQSALLSNSDELADELFKASQESHDKVWRMPMGEEYDKQLKSQFADIGNIGGPAAGTITAACFLARFAKKFAWAHLDIAGTAWISGEKKSATGRPVALLVQFLLNQLN